MLAGNPVIAFEREIRRVGSPDRHALPGTDPQAKPAAGTGMGFEHDIADRLRS
jgi:hypothetical protein